MSQVHNWSAQAYGTLHFLIYYIHGRGIDMAGQVVFFGESLTPAVRERSHELVSAATNVVVVGSALATYSAFRLVREAADQ